jgi:hypothetical protein
VPRFAVRADDVDGIADRLEVAFGLLLERRSNSYRGEYRLGAIDSGELRVFENSDPMCIDGDDDPEDKFFESDFSNYGVLVDIEGPETAVESVREGLKSVACAAVEIRRTRTWS